MSEEKSETETIMEYLKPRMPWWVFDQEVSTGGPAALPLKAVQALLITAFKLGKEARDESK